jgi:predicted nuclease of predicted toxin-antitoxin system
MRFLLDENVHHGLLGFLTSLGRETKLSPKGLSNGKVLELAIHEERILVTHDQDFIKHEYPEKQPGIILIKIPPRNFAQLKTSMKSLLSEKTAPRDFVNRVFLLFEDRYEDFPFSWKTIKS